MPVQGCATSAVVFFTTDIHSLHENASRQLLLWELYIAKQLHYKAATHCTANEYMHEASHECLFRPNLAGWGIL